MDILTEHIEYLLQRHDCVAVPGIGSLMVRYRSAHFSDTDQSVLMPPSREVVFNGELREPDGLLERSVGRRRGVSFEAARRMVADEVESLYHQLYEFGAISIGRIGELKTTPHGGVLFTPGDVTDWDNRFYGLAPLCLSRLSASAEAETVAPDAAMPAVTPWQPDENEEEGRGRIGRAFVGVAASLAVIVTLALFFINPIKVSNEPVKASLAPAGNSIVATVTPDEDVAPAHVDAGIPSQSDAAAPTSSLSASAAASSSAASVSSAAVAVKTDVRSAVAATASQTDAATVGSTREIRFEDTDKFCVIVASFPDAAQARRYVAENSSRRLGVLNSDGKYRVYAATGSTYADAESAKHRVGASDAWICRR